MAMHAAQLPYRNWQILSYIACVKLSNVYFEFLHYNVYLIVSFVFVVTSQIQVSLTDVCTEMERFIEENTQKLAENKYLCPLSGKKFKGPDFVRKHIFNKHMEKVEAVKQEVCSKNY